jgi:hypothetical protein
LAVIGNTFSNTMQNIEIKLPNNPMYISTIIVENDKGKSRPLTNEATKNGIKKNIKEYLWKTA